VHVDPIKPTLKAHGTRRLKLKYHTQLSSLAFNFDLRCYIEEVFLRLAEEDRRRDEEGNEEAGAYTRPLCGST